ncbi:hypothetical protein THF1D04_10720 [Vibrio owensii]|uniref:Uncharacterized protein n=1 Tax=Vibrio owensii TaxID=696485 RepID=A0AAU9PZZ2_9VIBR|nr:hypothetical protein THF1D04_10720 [Vibrio owensii]
MKNQEDMSDIKLSSEAKTESQNASTLPMKTRNQEFEEFALGEGVDPHGLEYIDFEIFHWMI